MEFDFGGDDRPDLVTQILAACVSWPDGAPLDTEAIWNLTVSRRIEWLLRLAAAPHNSLGRIPLQCLRQGCGQVLEIELPLDALFAVQRRAEEREWIEWQSPCSRVRFRRPTGNDQRRWRAASFSNADEAQAAILQGLMVGRNSQERSPSEGQQVGCRPGAVAAGWNPEHHGDKAFPPGDAATLDLELEVFDPLVAFSIRAACPQCNVESDFPLDLEALALGELARAQRQLLQDIHRLASCYHWSESEILALGAGRRTRYLRLMDAEEAR